MQLGSALMIFGALHRLGRGESTGLAHERLWVMAFCFGLVSLCGSSLLGMIWSGTAFLGLPFLFSRTRGLRVLPPQSYAREMLLSIMICLGLGFYYLWTVKQGMGATPGKTDLTNVAFIGYELAGFAGLGPGRLAIRDGGFRTLFPYLPELLAYGVMGVILLTIAWRKLSPDLPRRTALAMGAAVLTPFGFCLWERASSCTSGCWDGTALPFCPPFCFCSAWALGICGRGAKRSPGPWCAAFCSSAWFRACLCDLPPGTEKMIIGMQPLSLVPRWMADRLFGGMPTRRRQIIINCRSPSTRPPAKKERLFWY